MMDTKIEDSFEDRKSSYLFGLAAWVYWLYHFFSPKSASRLLPGAKPIWIAVIFILVFILQIFVWVYFKHFQKKWYLNIRSFIFFFCEMGILTFTLAFILWPVFLTFKSKLI